MASSKHPPCDDRLCKQFACKARYWRHERPLRFKYTQGQDFFHNETVAGSIRETLEVAAADGRELEYVGGGPAAPPVAALGVV